MVSVWVRWWLLVLWCRLLGYLGSCLGIVSSCFGFPSVSAGGESLVGGPLTLPRVFLRVVELLGC